MYDKSQDESCVASFCRFLIWTALFRCCTNERSHLPAIRTQMSQSVGLFIPRWTTRAGRRNFPHCNAGANKLVRLRHCRRSQATRNPCRRLTPDTQKRSRDSLCSGGPVCFISKISTNANRERMTYRVAAKVFIARLLFEPVDVEFQQVPVGQCTHPIF